MAFNFIARLMEEKYSRFFLIRNWQWIIKAGILRCICLYKFILDKMKGNTLYMYSPVCNCINNVK